MFVVCTVAAAALAAGPDLSTEDDKTLYAIGLALSRNLTGFSLNEKELGIVQAGIADGTLGKEKKVDLQTYMPKINQLMQARQTAAAAGEKKASEAYLAKAAGEKGAEKLPSGLIYKETKAGSGDSPKASDTVKVH